MKLQGVFDGTLYAVDGRRVLRGTPDEGGLTEVGQLPVPGRGVDALAHWVSTAGWRWPLEAAFGAFPVTNVWPITEENLVATVGNRLLTSHDGGRSWHSRWRLPDSSGPMGVLPTAFAVHDGTVFVGEYPLDEADTARILASDDHGRTWSVFQRLPSVRHIHSIQCDPYTDRLWVTAGDTDEESVIGRLTDSGIDAVGRGSQQWRAVELAFTPDAVLWGVDCVYAASNEIHRLPREQFDSAAPTPRAVCRTDGSVYYGTATTIDGVRWVAFATAAETGVDTTVDHGENRSDVKATVYLWAAAWDPTDWRSLASYHKRRCVADCFGPAVPSANGYVFLGSDPQRGLVLNPYNTRRDSGSLVVVSPSQLARLSSDSRGH